MDEFASGNSLEHVKPRVRYKYKLFLELEACCLKNDADFCLT